MAMVFQMHMAADGSKRPVPEARRFCHYVQNVRYWFAVHQAHDHAGALSVSHWDSGKRMCIVSPIERVAGVGMDDKELAKAALEKLVTKHGAARVASALRAAEAA